MNAWRLRLLTFALMIAWTACQIASAQDAGKPTSQPASQPYVRKGPMKIGTNFWQIDWGGSDPFKDGHRNVTGDNPWREDFLKQMQTYTCLRFMDYGRTNMAEKVHSPDWDKRKQKADKNQNPMAWEWQIDLCNRTGKDLWICVPHHTGPDYWKNLATLVRDTLDPKLKAYVEYSNETWNWQFSQAHYVDAKGKELKLWRPKHDVNKNGAPEQWANDVARLRAHVYFAARVCEVFEEVFGAQAKDRLVKVMAGQASDWCSYIIIEGAADPAVNPKGIKFDCYAIAPYFAANLNGGASIEQVRAVVKESLDITRLVKAELDGTGKWAKIEHVGQYGIPLVCYEGGQHMLNNARGFVSNPMSYTIYKEYLDGLNEIGVDLFMHYVHSGAWGGMAWGAMESLNQPMEQAHRYRALMDWVKEHPPVK